MKTSIRSLRIGLAGMMAVAVTGCATTYTGPVEVTRFVSEDTAGLGSGTIALDFPEAELNDGARIAFAQAVSNELERLGYSIAASPDAADSSAQIRTSRGPIAGSGTRSRNPVSVGVGGSTGSYGSGVGVGLGINLGGGSSGPEVVSNLSVRIVSESGETLWEGRAEQSISVKSSYADRELSARTLAVALFRDFPGGNGETVQLTVDELEGTP